MKVLLLGSNGMLGQAIKKQLKMDGYDLYGVDRSNADYCFDLLNDKRLEMCIEEVCPDIIINTAAIVSLEQCEGDPGGAYCLNARLPSVLAGLCGCYHCYFVHISTDHFYSGDRDIVHNESESIKLVNEYARTKYVGEQLALTYENSLILRTNIVGFRGRGQLTFIEWALSEAANRRRMTLFTDFYTSSIHTVDFSRILSDILKFRPTGIYNLASSEVTNKKDFVVGLVNALLGSQPDYIEGSVKNINSAPRGDSLGLNTGKIEKLLGYRMPDFHETIQSIKKEYVERRRHNEL